MTRITFCLMVALAFSAAPCQAAESAEPAHIDRALQENAPKILDFLAQKNADLLEKNKRLCVGVLKFMVKKGEKKLSGNVGPLNALMAERLEVALILALKDSRIRILRDPGQVVVEQMNRRANHLTKPGRQAFFRRPNSYPPAWGSEKGLPADIFLSGRIDLTDKMRKASITVMGFDSSGEEFAVGKFTARVDPRTLTEAGVSYRTRGGDLVEMEKDDSDDVRKGLPISLDVLYDGKVVSVEKGKVPEPKKGQKVAFRLKHGNKDKYTYGVVLKVNGRNTIYPEEKTSDEIKSWKWILKPGAQVEVTGFITRVKPVDDIENDSEKEEEVKVTNRLFEVASAKNADASQLRYQPHAGTFQVTVYRSRLATDKETETGKPSPEAGFIGRGFPMVTGGREDSLDALKSLLREKREKTRPSVRGFIGEGEEKDDRVKEVGFKPFGKPDSLTVRYYSPSK